MHWVRRFLTLALGVAGVTALLRAGLGWGWAYIALFWAGIFLAYRYIDERISTLLDRRNPRVWHFYFTFTKDFAERALTTRGLPWHPEKLDAATGLSELKLEEREDRDQIRAHIWLAGKDDAHPSYTWWDLRPVVTSDELQYAEALWSLKFREFGDPDPWRASLHLSIIHTKWPGTKTWCRALVFWVRWMKGMDREHEDTIFRVPLDEEFLGKKLGTGQEHAVFEGHPSWDGRATPESPDWTWSLTLESR